ncbi:unnamed protein product [Discosporangium mesarthrocarpum]
MSPMTRDRADMDLVPTDLMCTYYEQRTSAGLIITEATQVSVDGQGYPLTPGIFTADQIAGWKKITDAVHAKGSKIVLQIWNCGRVSHSSYQPGGAVPPAPSAVKPDNGQAFTMTGFQDFETPREMTVEEIKTCVEQFKQGAINAMEAGFDGVEIHGANGYLLDQFLKDGSNKRSDDYGGSLENRFRIMKEVLEAVTGAIGADKVGVHYTPGGTFNGLTDTTAETKDNFTYFIKQLNPFKLAYLHIKLSDEQDERHGGAVIPISYIRQIYEGILITNNRYHEKEDFGAAELAAGDFDAIAFGRSFLANPDLPTRIKKKADLNKDDHDTFFGGTEVGYTDYPFLE